MKIAIFIDGGNFYRKLKELEIKHTSKFDFKAFIQSLTKNVDPVYVGYYVGQIRKEKGNNKSEILYANQQKLFAYLKTSIPKCEIIRGHIQNVKGIYKEKGVDVRLALDIYKFANEDLYERAILISSDSDLIPAIKMVQEKKNKQVEYIGFANKPSFSLIKECIAKRLLNYDDIKPFEFKD